MNHQRKKRESNKNNQPSKERIGIGEYEILIEIIAQSEIIEK